jgi:hypothetical protein
MTYRLARAWLAVFIIAAMGALAACGNGDDDVPDGWSPFSEPEFRGVVHDEWSYGTLDASATTGDLEEVFADLPDETRNSLIEAVASANLQDTFFAFIDPHNDAFASNINVLSCGSGGLVPVAPDAFIREYAAGGIEAEELREVTAFEEESWLYRVYLGTAYETYQVPFRAGGACHSVATLTVQRGDSHFIDDFLVFIEHLELTRAE